MIKLKENHYENFLDLLDNIFDLFNDIILKSMSTIKEEKEEAEEKIEIKEVVDEEEKKSSSKYDLIKKMMNPEHTHYKFFEFLENLYKYLPDNQESRVDLDYRDLFFVNEPNWLKKFNFLILYISY